jgi:putative transposase
VSPDRRRRAVQVLRQRFGVSERRACAVVGQHRSTQRRPPRQPGSIETVLRARLREISRAHPRWGWRKAYWLLRGEGLAVNRKRIRRYWAEEGLKRPARVRKRQRIGPHRGDRLAASQPDEVWALDFQVDVTADGRQIRFCNVVDEFTREALATTAARLFTADDTTILLDKIVAETGRRPANLRMDNGPELTAAAMRDWCRFSDVATAFIEPGSPLAERLQRIVQRPLPRRVPGHRTVRHPPGGPGPGRGLEDRVQHHQTPRITGRTHPDPVPSTMDQPTSTLITAGPLNGAQSVDPITGRGAARLGGREPRSE